jgi:hypothetical protein
MSSSGFIYLKRDCPICAGTSRECRQSKQTNLIHCRGQINSIPSGWVFRGTDIWGFQLFAEFEDSDQEDSKWLDRQRDLTIKRQRNLEQRRSALAAQERDEAIRRIHKYFGLSSKHRQNLRDRGLCDGHINRLPYFSFHAGQEVPQQTPANLPGVRRGRLAVKEAGFACPIPNIDGVVVGWQNRFDDESNGKYRWPSGDKSSHLSNGELPIGVYRPDGGVVRRGIGHAEGFIKPDIIAQQWGLPTLGAASANFAASPKQWRLSLERLSAELRTTDIYWFVDAGSVCNPQVLNQYLRSWKKLKEWGYSVHIVWYSQVDKSIGDPDEISQEVRKSARLITISEYLDIAAKYGGIKSEKAEYSDEYSEYQKWELEEERVEEAQALEKFSDWFKQRAKRLKRLARWQHGVKSSGKECPQIIEGKNEIIFDADISLPSPHEFNSEFKPPKIIFKAGERLKVIAAAKKAGWQFVNDTSFMGLGKSHDAGLLFPNPSGDDGEKSNTIWYFDLGHTNPSTATVEQMKDLPPRHDGMVPIEGKYTPSGEPHLRWRKPDEVPMIPSLCHEADSFIQLQQKGWDINAEKESIEDDNGKSQERNKICKKCPFAGKCHLEVGDGFGYLFKRKEVLKVSQIRANIDSAPREDYDYSGDIAFVEEASRHLKGTKSLSAWDSELAKLWSMVERKAPEAFSRLQSLRFAFQDAFDGKFSKVEGGINRGTDHDALLENLPSITSIGIPLSSDFQQATEESIQELIAQVRKAMPSIDEIVEEADSVTGIGGKWRQAGNFVRNAFKAEAHQRAKENIENLPPNILIDFLEIWAGIKPGALRISGKKLTVTQQDTHQAHLLNQMSFVDLLDATGDKNHLAKILMVEPEAILEIEQERPSLDNLEVINVNLRGMKSRQISKDCEQRQEAFLKWVKEQHWDANVKALSLKGSHLDIDGHWFLDNRSTNAFKATDVIVAFHTPRVNLGISQDEYRAVYGCLDDGFTDYYNKLSEAEMIQLVGRQRAHQYPNRKFILYIVGTDQDLSYLNSEYGIQITNREAVDICVEAGSAGERTYRRIVDAARLMAEAGEKVTQQAIADQIGKSQKLISKTIAKVCGSWGQFKSLVLSLLDIHRDGTKPEDGITEAQLEDELPHEDAAAIAEILPYAAGRGSPETFIEEIVSVAKVYGMRQLRRILNLMPHEARVEVLRSVLAPLGQGFAQLILSEMQT